MCKYKYVYYSACRHQELVRFDYCEAAKRLISFTSRQSPSRSGPTDNADNGASVQPISVEQDFSDISSLSLTTSLDDYSPFKVPTGRKPHAYKEKSLDWVNLQSIAMNTTSKTDFSLSWRAKPTCQSPGIMADRDFNDTPENYEASLSDSGTRLSTQELRDDRASDIQELDNCHRISGITVSINFRTDRYPSFTTELIHSNGKVKEIVVRFESSIQDCGGSAEMLSEDDGLITEKANGGQARVSSNPFLQNSHPNGTYQNDAKKDTDTAPQDSNPDMALSNGFPPLKSPTHVSETPKDNTDWPPALVDRARRISWAQMAASISEEIFKHTESSQLTPSSPRFEELQTNNSSGDENFACRPDNVPSVEGLVGHVDAENSPQSTTLSPVITESTNLRSLRKPLPAHWFLKSKGPVLKIAQRAVERESRRKGTPVESNKYSGLKTVRGRHDAVDIRKDPILDSTTLLTKEAVELVEGNIIEKHHLVQATSKSKTVLARSALKVAPKPPTLKNAKQRLNVKITISSARSPKHFMTQGTDSEGSANQSDAGLSCYVGSCDNSPLDITFASALPSPVSRSSRSSVHSFVTAVEHQDTETICIDQTLADTEHTHQPTETKESVASFYKSTTEKYRVRPNTLLHSAAMTLDKKALPKFSLRIPQTSDTVQLEEKSLGLTSSDGSSTATSPAYPSRIPRLPIRVRRTEISIVSSPGSGKSRTLKASNFRAETHGKTNPDGDDQLRESPADTSTSSVSRTAEKHLHSEDSKDDVLCHAVDTVAQSSRAIKEIFEESADEVDAASLPDNDKQLSHPTVDSTQIRKIPPILASDLSNLISDFQGKTVLVARQTPSIEVHAAAAPEPSCIGELKAIALPLASKFGKYDQSQAIEATRTLNGQVNSPIIEELFHQTCSDEITEKGEVMNVVKAKLFGGNETDDIDQSLSRAKSLSSIILSTWDLVRDEHLIITRPTISEISESPTTEKNSGSENDEWISAAAMKIENGVSLAAFKVNGNHPSIGEKRNMEPIVKLTRSIFAQHARSKSDTACRIFLDALRSPPQVSSVAASEGGRRLPTGDPATIYKRPRVSSRPVAPELDEQNGTISLWQQLSLTRAGQFQFEAEGFVPPIREHSLHSSRSSNLRATAPEFVPMQIESSLIRPWLPGEWASELHQHNFWTTNSGNAYSPTHTASEKYTGQHPSSRCSPKKSKFNGRYKNKKPQGIAGGPDATPSSNGLQTSNGIPSQAEPRPFDKKNKRKKKKANDVGPDSVDNPPVAAGSLTKNAAPVNQYSPSTPKARQDTCQNSSSLDVQQGLTNQDWLETSLPFAQQLEVIAHRSREWGQDDGSSRFKTWSTYPCRKANAKSDPATSAGRGKYGGYYNRSPGRRRDGGFFHQTTDGLYSGAGSSFAASSPSSGVPLSSTVPFPNPAPPRYANAFSPLGNDGLREYVGYFYVVNSCGLCDVEMATEHGGGLCHKCSP